ncbi:MAG: nucleotidyltransferase family protein [Acetobacteraceae bacterium]
MSAAGMLDVPAEALAIVRAIPRAHLPVGALVWAFGLRAGGRVKPYSDLDPAIDAGRALTIDERAVLGEAFSESDLPWKMDVVDWRAAEAGFRARVPAGMVPVAWA